MDDTPEMIRQEMEETKARLADKLETLETQVAETVQSAGSAVNATVGAVQETVESVTGAVQSTVRSVGEAFDLRRQIDRNPWWVMGGAVAVGFLAAELFAPARREVEHPRPAPPPPPPAPAPRAAEPAKPKADGTGSLWSQLKNSAVGAFRGVMHEVSTQAVPELLNFLNVKPPEPPAPAPQPEAVPPDGKGFRKPYNSVRP